MVYRQQVVQFSLVRVHETGARHEIPALTAKDIWSGMVVW